MSLLTTLGNLIAPRLQGTSSSTSSAQTLADEMKFNSQEAQKVRDFQEKFAKNSYQWAVEDMKKAGLNPILLAGNGAGTISSPAASYSGFSSYEASKNSAQAVRYSADKSYDAVKYSAKANAVSNVASSLISSALGLASNVLGRGVSSVGNILSSGVTRSTRHWNMNKLYD